MVVYLTYVVAGGEAGEGAAGECERPFAAEGEGPEDEEEEEDLEPYDLSDSEEEEELRKVAKPRYLRRLVECECMRPRLLRGEAGVLPASTDL